MNWRDKPELQELLAAEYVLGTLRGRARSRFRAWLAEDRALRRRVEEWQARLAPMTAAVDEVQPPRRVWNNIVARLGPTPARKATRSWWDSLAFWRNCGLVATGCAAALVAMMVIRAPVAPPSPAPSAGMDPAFVAMVEDGKGNVVFLAYAKRDSNELWVKSMAMAPLDPGKDYELWGLPSRQGEPPRSLGMVPRDASGMIRLAALSDQVLTDYPKLAISIEPAGGSTTGLPTGPVVYQGECFKFW